MKFIPLQPDDDPTLIALLETLTRNLLRQQCAQELYLIRINNWFDHKWLGFSGKVLGAFGWWKYKLTLPPFHPHRVTQERYARVISCEPLTLRIEEHAPLHREQNSEQNLQRELSGVSSSGLFIWYGSQNERASVMVYQVAANEAFGWYAHLERIERWQIKRTKQIDKKLLAALFEPQ